jgi:RNA polymerase sigma-70 factor (ECF subfamily)
MTIVRKPSAAPIDGLLVTDAEALRRLAGGEASALAVLYDRHQPALYRFVAVATHHAHDVEDIVHQTFLTAARAAAAFDGRSSCRPWLLGIAARLLARRRRTLARWGRAMRELATRGTSPMDPQRELVARADVDELERAVKELSEPKRVVLLMSEVEGLTAEEIAKALGIPVGTVWTRLHHARRELRKGLERGRGA